MRKPLFRVESLGLETYQSSALLTLGLLWSYLFHGSKHFIAAPFGKAPIVVILLHSSNADGSVGATAPAEETSSWQITNLAVKSSLWC